MPITRIAAILPLLLAMVVPLGRQRFAATVSGQPNAVSTASEADLSLFAKDRITPEKPSGPGGELQIIGPNHQPAGVCPLKHTEVSADVSGYVARVHVRQTFHNPSQQKIEAVYIFPLPEHSAVDEMVMTVGQRRILG